MRAPYNKLGIGLAILGVFLFGGTLPATRLTIIAIDPLFLTAARAAIAGIAGMAVLLVVRRPIPPILLWREILLAGLCTIVGFPLFTALAMVSVPAAHGGIVLGILPLATTAAAMLVAHERPAAGFWLVSLLGSVIVIAFVLSESHARNFALGDLFLLGTVMAGAFGYALSGRLSLIMSGWEVISWQVVAFLPISALLSFVLWPPDLASIPLGAWTGLAYVGLVSQYLAFFVFNAAMALSGVARVGQFMLLQPFVIIMLAAFVNGEPIRIATLANAAAVVATVLIGQQMPVRRK
jgi:drug/metabolite transporter (DMT)-like permease